MIKLRLKKYGRKGQPCYRIVAMDSRTKRDGASIEELGFYNPMTDETHLKFQRIKARLEQGAQPTETVRDIFADDSHVLQVCRSIGLNINHFYMLGVKQLMCGS